MIDLVSKKLILYGICMGFFVLAGNFHFLNTMHENEAVYANLHSHTFMSIVCPIDAYGLIMSKLAFPPGNVEMTFFDDCMSVYVDFYVSEAGSFARAHVNSRHYRASSTTNNH